MNKHIISTFDELSIAKIEPILLSPDGYQSAPPCYSFTRGTGNALPTHDDEVTRFNDQLIKGYKILYDSPEAAHQAFEIGKAACDRLATAHPDEGINTGEADIASKFSIQRRLPPKFFAAMKKLPQGQFSPDFDMCLEAYVRKVAQLSDIKSEDPYRLMATDSDPFDTNQGFPTFSSQPEMRFTTAAGLGLSKYETREILSKLDLFVSNVGFDPQFRWPAAVAKRTGPTRKPVPIFKDAIDGSSIVATTEATGYFTRARQVYMMPFYFNILISPVAIALKRGRLSIRGFNHDSDGEASYLSDFKRDPKYTVSESDLSGFDASITPALRKRFWYWCRRYGFNSTALDLLDQFEEQTVIMTAPYNSLHSGEFSYTIGTAGLLSGLKITTELGSAISTASTLKALYRCGVISKEQILSGQWPLFLMLGDDILLRLLADAIDPAIFEASYAEEGLKVKFLSPGERFLMNHIYDGSKYGVACRLIQQSAFNEDSYEHIGQLRLGLASRLTKKYFPEHWRILRDWAKNMAGVVSCPEIYLIIATSDDSRAAATKLLNDPSINEFLASAAGIAWIEGILAKNAISGTFQAFIDLIAAHSVVDLASAQEQRNLLLKTLFSSSPRETSTAIMSINHHLQSIQP